MKHHDILEDLDSPNFGWFRPSAAKRSHFFVDDRSLCGNWESTRNKQKRDHNQTGDCWPCTCLYWLHGWQHRIARGG